MRSNYHNPSQSEDAVSKISRSKSRNQVTIVQKIKEKESGWNERFHLHHIPEYNYQNQPHSQYLKNKLRLPNKKNDRNDLSKARPGYQPSLDKNKVGNKPNQRKNEERQKQAINKAFTDLKQLWFQKNIPQCHMEVMTKIFNRQIYPIKIIEDIKHEFSQITKQTALIQKVISSVQSRQACLQKIHELIASWQKQQINIAKLTKLFEERINHLRILTVHCIQCVSQWRQSIQPLLPRNTKIKYIINGKNYLSKITQDYVTLTLGKLSLIYVFGQKKSDIFFLNYTYQGKKMSAVSKSILKRIRFCQMILNQEDNQYGQGQSKRTPLANKNKSPPIRNQKSLPPKGPTATLQKWKKVDVEYGQFIQYYSNSISKSTFSKSFLTTIQLIKYEQMTVFQNMDNGQQIVIGVDKNSSQRKIIIHSIKSNIQNVEGTVKSLCQYLWQSDNCSQIRISLVHFQNGQTKSVDPQLQKKLKAIGFRWVSVNHSNQNRLTIYSIKRPLNTIAHKTARRKQAYPIVVQHLCVLNLNETTKKKQNNRSLVSVITLFDVIKQKQKQQFKQICRRDQFSHPLQCMIKIQQFLSQQSKKIGISQGFDKTFIYSGLKGFQVDSQETGSKIFRNLQISQKKLLPGYPQYISLINSSFKFKHPMINHQKYTKFLPSKDSQILICQSNYPIYLLQSDQQMINFFIIQVQQTFSMDSIDSIFHAMGQQSSFLDDFWLPIFHKSQQYVDQFGFKNQQIISTDYWSCLGSMKRKGNKKRTKIIKPPFVFGLIHKKLLQILQIPFYCTLVRKQDLI